MLVHPVPQPHVEILPEWISRKNRRDAVRRLRGEGFAEMSTQGQVAAAAIVLMTMGSRTSPPVEDVADALNDQAFADAAAWVAAKAVR